MPGAQANEQKLGEDFLLRRAAGNGIELMGVVAFRASPVWVLAALADVAGFGRQLIPEIAESLKKEGLLAPDESFATMDQLLRARAQLRPARRDRERAAARRRGLARGVAQVRREARQLPAPQLPSAGAVTRLWQDLRATAEREQRSVFEVSSLLAVAAVGELPERARVLSKSAAIVLRHGGAARLERAARSLPAVAAGIARGRLPPLRRSAAHAVHARRDRRVRAGARDADREAARPAVGRLPNARRRDSGARRATTEALLPARLVGALECRPVSTSFVSVFQLRAVPRRRACPR